VGIRDWIAEQAIIAALREIVKSWGGKRPKETITMPKSGWKTTEFWVLTIGNVLAFVGPRLLDSAWTPDLQAQVTAFLAAAVNVGAAGYAIARAMIKARATK